MRHTLRQLNGIMDVSKPRMSRVLPILDKARLFDMVIKALPPHLIIIVYHNVRDPSMDREHLFYEEALDLRYIETQIRLLINNGYAILSLREALELIKKGIKKRIAVLTFDDGYRGVYDYVFPLLKRLGVRATLYLTVNFVRDREIPWWEAAGYLVREALRNGKLCDIVRELGIYEECVDKSQAYRSLLSYLIHVIRENDIADIKTLLDRVQRISGVKIPAEFRNKMIVSEDQVKEMAEYGIEIGGHGLYHVNLTKISRQRLEEELRISYEYVKKFSNHSEIITFAYPFGFYNDEVIELTKLYFNAAVTMIPHVNKLPLIDYHKLGRLPPYRFGLKDLSSFKFSIIKGILQ